jgi:hypothetical protein
VSYCLAGVAFGIAFWQERKTSTVALFTGIFFFFSTFMTLVMLLSDYGKQAYLQPLLPVLYPFALVVSRLLIGIFLWKAASNQTR